MIASIELDVYCEATEAGEMFAEVEAWIDDPSVTFMLVDPLGPGGGNPVFRFTGSLRNLYEIVAKSYTYDLDDVNDVFFDMLHDFQPEPT